MSFITKVQVRYRPADTDGAWSYYEVTPRTTTLDIPGVAPGKPYRIEARSVSSCGAVSQWAAVTHTVDGLAAVPQSPSGLTALAVADGVALNWSYPSTIPSDVAFEIWIANDGINFQKAGEIRAFGYTYPVLDATPRSYKVRARNVAGGVSAFTNTVTLQAVPLQSLADDIALALLTAMNAQATADHLVSIFYRTTAPVLSVDNQSYGDVWIDTDSNPGTNSPNGYRWNGGAWILANNDALIDALVKGITVDAKADGKVQTFFQPTPPPANTGQSPPHPPWPLGVGDLWFDTDAKKLWRWDGTTWAQNIGDVTLDQLAGTGVNILWDEYASLASTTVPALTPSGTTTPSYDTLLSVGYPTGSLRFSFFQTTNSANSLWCYFGNTSSDYNIPVVGGKTYIISAWAYSNVAGGGKRLQFQLRGDNGSLYGSEQTALLGAANTWVRVWNKVTIPANIDSAELLIWLNREGTAGNHSCWIDRVMIEEQIGTKTTPSTWSPGAAGRQALIAIQNAAFAQEAADGKITTFFQTTPPVAKALGDLWFDTDDGNKIYRWSGSAWVLAPDSRIAQAILDAAGAQATADGKVQTFYSTTTPTATGVGDLWFNTQTFILYRWSGSAWITGPGGVNSGSITNGVLNGIGQGRNVIQNPGFINNVGNHDRTNPDHADWFCDGWAVSYSNNTAATGSGAGGGGKAISFNTPSFGHGSGATSSPNSYCLEMYAGNGTSVANGIVARAIGFTRVQPPAAAGERYVFGCWFRSSFTVNFPANVSGQAFMTLHALDSDNAVLASTNLFMPRVEDGWKFYSSEMTMPHGTVRMQVNLEMRVTNNSGSTYTLPFGGNQFAWIGTFDDITVSLKPNMDIDIDDGDIYGRFTTDDGYFDGFNRRRIGLRFGGSGQQVGDVRNFYHAATASYVAVRTTGALQADSLGRVSVLAHTIRYGGVSVSYSAVTNAVTGLAQNGRYVIYCQDPDYSGGVRTYGASTSPQAVMNISPYVVIMGEIIIPTAGTSSGGGGGGGGSEWCVAVDQYMPEGYKAGDVEAGDFISCWDENCEKPGAVYSQVLDCPEQDGVECLQVIAASGATLVASTTTPFTLKDGTEVKMTELEGQEVLVLHTEDGKAELHWEPVVGLYSAGKRRVKKINLGNKTYFAGGKPEMTIASHNIKMGNNAP